LVARLYGATPHQTTFKIILPATVPWIVAATRLSIANSLAGAIVAEMFLGNHGLGFLIVNGSGVFDTGEVFAAILAALILAGVLDWLGTLAERRLLRWRPRNH
jgi:NitT/TauT family transport system permease protein